MSRMFTKMDVIGNKISPFAPLRLRPTEGAERLRMAHMADLLPTTVIDTQTRLMPMFRLLLHNDDVNRADHVVHALQEVLKFDHQQCVVIMLEAHNTGIALCTIEPLEHAEFHQEQLQSLSLAVTIEAEG